MGIVSILKYQILIIVLSLTLASCKNSNQVAKLEYEMSGCFGSSKSTMIIYKKESIIIAKLVTDSKAPVEKTLTQKQIEKFNLFKKELMNLKEDGGCTTLEYYALVADNKKTEKTDAGCDWNGFANLEKALFGTP